MKALTRHARRLLLETLGWAMVLLGLVALVLPGPGLLLLFGGFALLSQQYPWAERRVEPIKHRALEAARHGVATMPRIAGSSFGVLVLAGLAAAWVWQPGAPSWWPLPEHWWLPGGPMAGLSIAISAVIAAGTLIYSVMKFYPGGSKPADSITGRARSG